MSDNSRSIIRDKWTWAIYGKNKRV